MTRFTLSGKKNRGTIGYGTLVVRATGSYPHMACSLELQPTTSSVRGATMSRLTPLRVYDLTQLSAGDMVTVVFKRGDTGGYVTLSGSVNRPVTQHHILILDECVYSTYDLSGTIIAREYPMRERVNVENDDQIEGIYKMVDVGGAF